MTIRKEQRSEVLERVRKLLAMAGDTGSPREAAIAARRAKKLMDRYNIDHAETIAAELTEEDFEAKLWGRAYIRYPLWINMLSVGVADFTDTRVRFVPLPFNEDGYKAIQFEGERSDIQIAEYLMGFLIKVVNRLTEASGHPADFGLRGDFRRGCVQGIIDQLCGMKREERKKQATDGKELILVNRKKQLIDAIFGAPHYKRSSGGNTGFAYDEGQSAGASVAIRRAMTDSHGHKALTGS